MTFKKLNIIIDWEGKGINEIGRNRQNGEVIVSISDKFFRPTEVDLLIGDYSKANKELNWKPETSLEELVGIMVNYELKRMS
jgi:GDPmannose 4,6-dehydratase